MKPPPALRRLTALVSAVLMILASPGLAPTASADTSDDSLSYEFEIHENDVVDLTMTRKGDDAGSKSNCDPDDIENVFDDDDVKVSVKSGDGGNSCTVTIKGMTIKKFNNNMPSAEITHDNKSKSFTFEMYGFGFDSDNQVSVKVTFPGSVSKVSGDGKKSGRTATWENAHEETEALTAKGADHGSPLFMIIIIVVVIIASGVAPTTAGGIASACGTATRGGIITTSPTSRSSTRSTISTIRVRGATVRVIRIP